jgi:hypothetical protein
LVDPDQIQDNRREHYRVGDLADVPIWAEVVEEDAITPVHLLDLSFRGVGMRVEPGGPGFTRGTKLVIRFHAGEESLPVLATATVRFIEATDEGTRYGLYFADTRALSEQLPGWLVGTFNRRSAYRVTPAPGRPIEARISRIGREEEIQAPLISLSASGCAIMTTPEQADNFRPQQQISIAFTLADAVICHLIANIQYGVPQEGGIRFGIHFNAEKTSGFDEYQRKIRLYVMARERSRLQHLL